MRLNTFQKKKKKTVNLAIKIDRCNASIGVCIFKYLQLSN